MNNWIDVFIKLLPIILELFGGKSKAKEVTSTQSAMACWQDPQKRAKFIAQVCIRGLARGKITLEEAAIFIRDEDGLFDDQKSETFISVMYAEDQRRHTGDPIMQPTIPTITAGIDAN